MSESPREHITERLEMEADEREEFHEWLDELNRLTFGDEFPNS